MYMKIYHRIFLMRIVKYLIIDNKEITWLLF